MTERLLLLGTNRSQNIDHTRCLMNAGPTPGLVFEQHGEACEVLDEILYRHLLKEADL